MKTRGLFLVALLVSFSQAHAAPDSPDPGSPDDVLKASPAGDWQSLDPANTLVMRLPAGRVTIVLAPNFAPKSIAAIKTLVQAGYFDNSAIVRSQDNYVIQWAQDDEKKQAKNLTGYAEFERPVSPGFTPLPDPDTYAPQTGFEGGFPVASDGQSQWLVHCYGMVGVGRDMAADSGTGAELYAVTGQAPRHLDRNITLAGRVVEGMERLSALPRGTGALGFYETPAERIRILSIRLASDLPSRERPRLEILKTSSATFASYVAARRNRGGWFVRPAGRIDVCNIPVPVRPITR